MSTDSGARYAVEQFCKRTAICLSKFLVHPSRIRAFQDFGDRRNADDIPFAQVHDEQVAIVQAVAVPNRCRQAETIAKQVGTKKANE